MNPNDDNPADQARLYDENGDLKIDTLSSEEILLVRDEIQTFVNNRYESWLAKYGPFEVMSVGEISRDELETRLASIPDNLIWANANYWDGSTETPTRGFQVGVNGYAWLPGSSHYAAAIEAEEFFIATSPWDGDPYLFDPVYTFMQFSCVFCDGSGERGDEECG